MTKKLQLFRNISSSKSIETSKSIGVRDGTPDTSGEVPGRRTQNGVGLKTSAVGNKKFEKVWMKKKLKK